MRNKGFTLIELLAVLAVLALISVIVIPSIDRFLRNADDTTYQVQLDLIVDAVKNWEADNPDSLPKNHNDTYIVFLSELISGNYIREDLINPRTKEPFSPTLSVTIKNVNDRHEYIVNVNS
jgi:type IV pilus assembly protein PilA